MLVFKREDKKEIHNKLEVGTASYGAPHHENEYLRNKLELWVL